jgi:hypothetical protein
MIGIIESWEKIKGPVAKRIKERAGSPVRNPTLLAPIARPGKILAIGLNFAVRSSVARRKTHQLHCLFPSKIAYLRGTSTLEPPISTPSFMPLQD